MLMKTSTIAIISFCAIALASCNKKSIIPVKGRGESVSKTYNASGFDRIALSIDADVDYTQDSVYYVEVYAQSNIHDELRIEVEGTELHIDSKKTLWHYDAIRITVHSPSLYGIDVSGSGDLKATNLIKTSALNVSVSGSGSVKLASLNATELKADLSGAGNLTISGGFTTTQTLQTSGAGDLDLISMGSERCTVHMSGAGNASVHVEKQLNVDISGSGNVRYSGNPTVNSEISGSGKLISVN